ncbi:MAG: DegV family protein [Clostridiaceae bacterium]|nr:DegV family protein [Clostridiaceae bacterium]
MSKIALITDSTSDLNKEEVEKNNIHILPLRIIYKDREYIDRVNITPDEVYNNLSIEVPSTSLPSMEDIDKLFIKLEEEGYTHVIGTCISSGLSGTFNSINLISQQHPNITSHIFDSRSLTLGTGAIILECARMIELGKDFEEIVAKLPSIRNRIKVYYVVDTLAYLIKGGRIGKVSGTIGELFKIKPIISITEEGIYYTYEKVRGRNQSIARLIDIARVLLEQSNSKVWVLQGGAIVEGKALYESISKLPNLTETDFRDISPVMGVHTGPGLLGIVIMGEE